MPRPNRQIESMTRLLVGHLTIRVWRTETDVNPFGPDRGNSDLYNWAEQRNSSGIGTAKALLELEQFPRVAAIEVLDSRSKSGYVLYPDWK